MIGATLRISREMLCLPCAGFKKKYFWLSRTQRPKPSRNLFKNCSKSTPGWFMDGRMSDVDGIFILFMKMKKEFCSRLGSKLHKNKLCKGFFFMYVLTNKNNAKYFVFPLCIRFFLDSLIIQYTLHTFYTTQNTQNIFLKTYRPSSYWVSTILRID